MKKFGILTRHCYPNYGSILQAYALENALRKLGAEVVIIDYVQHGDKPLGLINSTLKVSHMRNSMIKRIIYRIVQLPTFLLMGLVFRSHQKRLLTLTKEVSSTAELGVISNQLDYVIAGSDQIWNRITGAIDPSYFLNFVKEKNSRVSYAASLGSEKPREEDEYDVEKLLKEMAVVSVREPTAKKWVKEKNIDVRDDIDPVLLHSREFWNNFAEGLFHENPYILVYQLHNTKGFSEKLALIKAKYNLPVIRITPDIKHLIKPGKVKVLISPERFVAAIRDAKVVVTDSFHGTAFSLRMGTPLYVIAPGKYSTRLEDILSRMNLDRLKVQDDTDVNSFSPEYDINAVDELLTLQSEKSIKYLSGLARKNELE